MHGTAFYEIAAILGMATLLGVFGQKLRQPLIIMFLATGILVGPSCFDLIQGREQIELLANIGIAILLFIVGLKLDLTLIRTTGPVALATGLGQIIFTSIIGFLIALALDMNVISAAYVAVALTFSSTIIIVKLLSDKKEIDSLHGQIAVGFLIVQDIAAILALVGLRVFGSQVAGAETGQGSAMETALIIAGKGVGFLAGIGLLMRFVLPKVLRRLAHSQELLTLFAIAWAVLLGALGEYLGFSKEVGAFLAGISLASTAYRDSIGARLVTLRDFLLLFFFIDLGARLDWSTVGSQIVPAIILSVFVLIGNPIIVLIIMGIMGYRRRTGFLAGLTVAQISEFSLIVAALGLTLGHISPETMGLVTLVGVATIFASTYMILYSAPLYRLLSRPLMIFERKIPFRETAADSLRDLETVDVILMGLGNYGSGLAEYLLRRGGNIVGVDFDPGVLDKWHARGLSVLYGDMADPEMHEQLPLSKTKWVVSCVRSKELNLALVEHLRERGYEGNVALTAANKEEADLFESMGVRAVFRPFADAAEQAADALTHAMDMLPHKVDWPIAFREIRIRSEAAVAGQTLRNIPLRSLKGVSILAVSRAGRVHYGPGPDFHVYPGDRLVIMGPEGELGKAEDVLNQVDATEPSEGAVRFELAEIRVAENSPRAGQTLMALEFRKNYEATVIGIRRGETKITSVSPNEKILGGDCLIVIGTAGRIEKLKSEEPL
jgi:Kef-type K+ transport system membrane component KefB/Trk K+ transport system NAD-binding subunit